MAMIRTLSFILLLFSLSAPISADINSSDSKIAKEVPIRTDPDDKRHNHPRKPARNPLKVILMEDCLIVTCDYEAMGYVEVVDNYTGIISASEEGELYSGLTLTLSDYHEGEMEIQITLNNKIYRGFF